MIPAIALTQFAFAIIGSISLIVLSKAQNVASLSGWRELLSAHCLWMLLVPLIWMFAAGAVVRMSASPGVEKLVRASGILVSALLALAYVWAIMAF